MTRQYPVIYEWSGRNFAGYAPDVPGCMATGKTLDLMRSTLKGALESHLQWMHDDGDTIPNASDEVTVDMEPDAEFPQPRGYYVIVEKLTIKMPKVKASAPKLTKIKISTTKRRVLQAA
jgi:predicted RNase H-like HicB family nuclease